MEWAIFADVHGNLDALEAVLADARAAGAGRYACLGDIVGYGAEPDACCERVRALGCAAVVRGNHDHACSHRTSLAWFNPRAAEAARWTREHLSEENRAWLRTLPYRAVAAGAALVHGSLFEPPHWDYVVDTASARRHFERQRTETAFVGHSHVPCLFALRAGRVLGFRPPATPLVLDPGAGKYLVNVGSVGQPRDGDPHACYCLYDPEAHSVEWRRVEYDAEAAARKIRAAGLPDVLAARLLIGR